MKRLAYTALVLFCALAALAACKKAPEQKAEPVARETAKPAKSQKSKIVKDLAALEGEERKTALKHLKEEHREQQKKAEEEESAADVPAFFPVSEGARRLIENANLLFRQGAGSVEKIAALEELNGIDHPDILPTINLALEDSDPIVREVALEAIMNINSPEVVPTVVKALNDPEPDLRLVSLDALMDVKGPAINEAFAVALKDSCEEVREGVLDLIFVMESPDALPSIKTAMLDESPDIRENAIMCIEDIPSKDSVDILIYDGLISGHEDVREASKESLEYLTDQEFETFEQAKAWWQQNRDTFKFDF